MSQIKKLTRSAPIRHLRNSFQHLMSVYTPGSNKGNQVTEDHEISENRYSVLYTYKGQYHHVGYSSEAAAQAALSLMMTDESRIPAGIYDAKNDSFEWDLVGQYMYSQHTASEQHSRLNEVLTIARALRRRDSSWQPGYLQRPGLFA